MTIARVIDDKRWDIGNDHGDETESHLTGLWNTK